MKKIYLAGPQVFSADVEKISSYMLKVCKEYGFEGLFPLDNECETSLDIYQSNLNLIDSSDIVIACIDPFRGTSLDSGTAFEIGYAKALNKPIYAYKADPKSEYIDRVSPCEDFPIVEDFGLTENLMISHSCIEIHDSIESILKSIIK